MPDADIIELLSPAVLARIDNYALLARTVVDGVLSGLHRSLLQGYGSEFFQYRDYVPGDDLKYLDWKAFARLDRYYIKLFQEETNMNCCFVLDTSASMAYRGDRAPCTKLRYASMLVACLAYVSRRQGDRVGFYAYNEGLTSAIRPGTRTGHLHRVLVEIARVRAAGRARHGVVLGQVAEDLRRRGMLVLVSDFLGVEEDLGRWLRRFRFAGHECLVVQVLDPDELDFPFSGSVKFRDAEDGIEVVTAPEVVADSYRQDMERFTGRLRLAALEQGADYLRASTTDNLGRLLAAYLHRRGSRH